MTSPIAVSASVSTLVTTSWRSLWVISRGAKRCSSKTRPPTMAASSATLRNSSRVLFIVTTLVTGLLAARATEAHGVTSILESRYVGYAHPHPRMHTSGKSWDGDARMHPLTTWLALVGSVWALFALAEEHLAPPHRAQITRWLRGQTPCWPATFVAVCD